MKFVKWVWTDQTSGFVDLCEAFIPGGAPLHFTSSHPFSVHLSWPLGRLHHFTRVCNDSGLYQQAANAFMKRFGKYQQSPRVLERLDTLHKSIVTSSTLHVPAKKKGDNTWLILPYHPSLAHPSFGCAIRGIQQDFTYHGYASFAP